MQTIREYRKSKGVSVTAAAGALGVSRPTYYGYEENPEKMTVEMALALCDFLGIEPSEIFLQQAISFTNRKEADGEETEA